MVSMSSWMLSMKVILISAGVVLVATGLRFSIPIAVDEIPALWSIILSWLKPPYLYIIINGIIITIAATSRFHQSHSDQPALRSEHSIAVKPPAVATFESMSAQSHINSAVEEESAAAAAAAATFESLLTPPLINTAVEEPADVAAEFVVSEIEDKAVDLKPVTVNRSKVNFATEEDTLVEAESKDVFDDSTFAYSALPREMISPEVQLDSLLRVREKPLASSRFVHRKPNRTTPEGPGMRAAALRVARPKRQETLESTWKMITEGRHVPLTRHLKKSDTWEHHVAPAMDHVPKSATFKERSNYESPPVRIQKEPSLGQDELNRRVEAFIKKFNEDIRMQRQESLNQYMEMINRGV